MFDFVRTHTRLALGFMLLLIIPSFVFFGVQGYSRFSDPTNATVAKVDGVSISRAEWDAAHKRNVDMARRQSPTLDAALFDTPQLRQETLDGLVRERLLQAAANQLHLYPTVARMSRLFDSDPQFAGLRGPDGKISRDLLAAQGMTPEMFDQRLRQDLAVRQVLAGLTQTATAPGFAASAALDAFLQRRQVQLQIFDATAYRAKVNPSDTEIETYFKAHEVQFRAPEQAAIEYVVLDLETLGKGASLTDEALRKAYADNVSRYTAPEERRASHILIKAEQGASAADRAKAKARAEALLAEVRKNPAGFGDLARKNSEDPGSAAKGGDLDFFARGAMVKPFEDAAFTLKSGEVSGLVQSDFGYHIIMLTGVRGGQVQPFEAVRAEVESGLRKSQAQQRWAEAAEQFTNTAYEQSDSLKPVIEKLKLEKKTATVLRTPAPEAAGPLASTKLLDAIFANDTLRNKRNTDAVEVGPNQLVSARIVQHSPARTLPLAEVKDTVRQRLVEEQAAELAGKEGRARLAALQAGSKEPLPTTLTVSRGQTQGLPKPVLDAALRADVHKQPAVSGVDLGAQGYVVLLVTQVLPPEMPPGSQDTLRAQYAQAWAAAESDAYLAALKKRFKAEIKPAAAVAAEAASAPVR
ncbi:MAG: SurA N-terminal domain-containing protein [Rubrivivax sp.]|nr:SurA N-terminal domain-containing protein [Rubrivivax sp.]